MANSARLNSPPSLLTCRLVGWRMQPSPPCRRPSRRLAGRNVVSRPTKEELKAPTIERLEEQRNIFDHAYNAEDLKSDVEALRKLDQGCKTAVKHDRRRRRIPTGAVESIGSQHSANTKSPRQFVICPAAHGLNAECYATVKACGPVTQLDRASDFRSEGWGFDSLRGRQRLPW